MQWPKITLWPGRTHPFTHLPHTCLINVAHRESRKPVLFIKSPPSQHYTPNFASRRNILIALIQYVHAWVICCAISLDELLLSFFGQGVVHFKHPLLRNSFRDDSSDALYSVLVC
uniref:Uncharacterized protein n=1 Tax=Arundo donax TaxID=35708 RepID=A0A0A9D789_ARUDO